MPTELEPLMMEVDGKQVDFRQHWNSVEWSIQLADVLAQKQPDMIYSGRNFGGAHIQCSHDEEHETPGKVDTSVFVDNPNGKNPATLSCRHGHCEHRETADHVFKLIEDGKLNFADVDPVASVSSFIKKMPDIAKIQFYTKTPEKVSGKLPNPDGLSDSEIISAMILEEIAKCDKDTPAKEIRDKIIRPTVLAGTSDDLNDVKRLLSSLRGGQGKADLNAMVKEVRRDISNATTEKEASSS